MMNNKTGILVAVGFAACLAVALGLFFNRTVLSDEVAQDVNPNARMEIVTEAPPAVSIQAKEVDELVQTTNPFAGRYVTYNGINNVTADKPVYLINPDKNEADVYMNFVITEGDKVLYESELVEAGKGIEVMFSDFLESGSHKVTVTMNPYLLYDGEFLKCPVNNAQDITVSLP